MMQDYIVCFILSIYQIIILSIGNKKPVLDGPFINSGFKLLSGFHIQAN